MDRQPQRYRLVPRKGGALLYTLFFGFFILVSLGSFDPKLGFATVAGPFSDDSHEVTGSLAHYGLATIFIVVSGAFVIWFGRRLIPGSPLDHLELGPDGLTVSGLFGRRRLQWKSISKFSVRTVPSIHPPIFWIRAVPRKQEDGYLRLGLGGCTRFTFASPARKDIAAIAAWLQEVKASYGRDDGAGLPAPPEELTARIIALPNAAATAQGLEPAQRNDG
jgi:hypothetical protein